MIAVVLVSWGLPQTGLFNERLINYGDNWVTLAIFSAVLALLNTFVRPILAFLSSPITCMTVGLFTIVINAVMFGLAAFLVPGFDVVNVWGALLGAVAISVVGIVVNMVVRPER